MALYVPLPGFDAAAATAQLNVATTTLKGLMSAADKVKVNYDPDVIDDVNLSASGTYTTAAFTANAYRKVDIEFNGSQSGNSYLHVQMNADSSLKYQDFGQYWNTAPTSVSSAFGVLGYAQAGLCPAAAAYSFKLTIYPKTNGQFRVGTGRTTASNAALGSSYAADTSFAWNDTTTDITFVTLSLGGQTWTGRVVVLGYP